MAASRKESNKRYRLSHKSLWAQYEERNRLIVVGYLSEHSCVDCGETDPDCLEFDHVRGTKKKNVGGMVGDGSSVATLMKEIAKCDVRCANCHSKRHARERKEVPKGNQ